MVHPLLNGYIASLCCSVANTPPTIWTNLKFQQYTALADPSWAFIHSAHFIELIEKHRDSFPWFGPFNPQDLTSNIRYHVPDLVFPAAALIELTASEHLCPCLSERERRVWGLFCPHCHRCYRVTIVTEESYKVTMAAPAGLRDSVTTL